MSVDNDLTGGEPDRGDHDSWDGPDERRDGARTLHAEGGRVTRPPQDRLDRALELVHGARGAWLMGRRVNDPGAPQEVLDPTAGSTLTTFDAAGPTEVTAAMPELAAAAAAWAELGWTGRMRYLKRFWAEVEAHAEDLAMLDTYDAGLPIATSRADLSQSLGAMEALIGWSLEAAGRTYPPPTDLMRAMTLRQPYGVVAAIVPYNHPAKFALVKTMPALLAGNVVLLKPSDQTPLSAMLLGELASRTLPPGAFNVVPGDHRVGAALVEDPHVGRVSFTGSTDVGIKVARSLAAHMGTAHLELGGKNATIVLEDADLAGAAAAAVTGMDFARSSGQACWSLSRIFVADSVADDFMELVVSRLEAIVPGDPFDDDCGMGPMSTVAGYERFAAYRDASTRNGSSVVYAPTDPAFSAGLFRSPVVADVTDPGHPVMQEEIFGPFLSVHRLARGQDPVPLVNASPYGLTGSVWSGDLSRALRLAEGIQAGYVWVNAEPAKPQGLPFGGWKMSGYGAGTSSEEVLDWTRGKSIIYSLS